MGKCFISMKTKLDALSHIQQFKSICGAPRNYSTENNKFVVHKFVRGKKIENELAQKLKTNSVTMKVHNGRTTVHHDLERIFMT